MAVPTKKAAAQQKAATAAKGTGPGKTPVQVQPTSLATTTKGTALAKPSIADLLHSATGVGLESMTADTLSIPRLSIIQSGSPQVKKGDAQFIKGAEQGDFYDNVAQDVFAKSESGFQIIFVSFRKTYIEWTLRESGGGFVADHGPDDRILQGSTRDDKGRDILKNKNQIVLTFEYYCFVWTEDDPEPKQAVISLTSTQVKKGKRLNSLFKLKKVNGVNPPIFYTVFTATTVPESNDKGSWMGWQFVPFGDITEVENAEGLWSSALDFYKSIQKGEVKVAAPAADGVETTSGPQSEDDAL